MVDNLAAQVELAVKRRATKLPLTLAPATLFDPRLPGFAMPADRGFRPSEAPVPPLPERGRGHRLRAGDDARGAGSATRAITSARLTEIYLDRIARIGPKLECIAVATPELAREQAKRADALLADGHLSRAAARHPLGLQGHPRHRRHRHRLGRRALSRARARAETHGGARSSPRQARSWSPRPPSARSPMATSGTAASPAIPGTSPRARAARAPARPRRPLPGSCAFAIGTETLGSIVAPSLRCGATGLRPDLRPRLPRRRHAALLDARQDRPDLPHRRGHRAGARRDQRP